MLCAILLGLGARRVRSRMLVWSAICFALLAAANIVLVLDFVVFPGLALWPVRQGLSLLAVGSLVYGLIVEER
ncbi:hypothetical protein FW784_08950 [Lysobacter lacus]|uniref:Uncharacterized protein n=2 Tax=Cognatilysobacter lacus TaxID=1643323 RepID=A0A5D8Z3C8_9GAMM|nr:hypothetical protein FW784_08950 [Lysobacter lacus]